LLVLGLKLPNKNRTLGVPGGWKKIFPKMMVEWSFTTVKSKKSPETNTSFLVYIFGGCWIPNLSRLEKIFPEMAV